MPGHFILWFLTTTLMCISPIHATCPVNLTLLNLIILITFGGVQIMKLPTVYDSPTSCHLFALRVEYYHNYPVLRHNLCSLNATDQVSHTCKISIIIQILFTGLFLFKTHHFRAWNLSPSSGNTYSAGPNR
jgi:hypothetical protein